MLLMTGSVRMQMQAEIAKKEGKKKQTRGRRQTKDFCPPSLAMTRLSRVTGSPLRTGLEMLVTTLLAFTPFTCSVANNFFADAGDEDQYQIEERNLVAGGDCCRTSSPEGCCFHRRPKEMRFEESILRCDTRALEPGEELKCGRRRDIAISCLNMRQEYNGCDLAD